MPATRQRPSAPRQCPTVRCSGHAATIYSTTTCSVVMLTDDEPVSIGIVMVLCHIVFLSSIAVEACVACVTRTSNDAPSKGGKQERRKELKRLHPSSSRVLEWESDLSHGKCPLRTCNCCWTSGLRCLVVKTKDRVMVRDSNPEAPLRLSTFLLLHATSLSSLHPHAHVEQVCLTRVMHRATPPTLFV